MSFSLVTISDIIDKHKGIPAIIQCHGPSANNNVEAIHKFYDKNEAIIFGVNEWHMFENDLRPDYWLRAYPQEPSIQNAPEYFNDNAGDDITLLSCDIADSTPLDDAMKKLTCKYLPFDLRHFNRKTCQENYEERPGTYMPRYFTFFPDCCNRRGRLTLQEEVSKYTNYDKLYSPSTHTSAINMIAFAILMGCSPIYINGMDLDYQSSKGTYAKLKDNVSMPDIARNAWSDWRKEWITRDFNIINDSANNIGTKIINLKENAWYGIFQEGDI